jgi:hypothetical protein
MTVTLNLDKNYDRKLSHIAYDELLKLVCNSKNNL